MMTKYKLTWRKGVLSDGFAKRRTGFCLDGVRYTSLGHGQTVFLVLKPTQDKSQTRERRKNVLSCEYHVHYNRGFLSMRFLGPNAVSVSLSPLSRFVLVGLASRKLHWHLTAHQVRFLKTPGFSL